MIGALLFLQFTSIKNSLRQRFLRLRHPRYLLGALAGLAYFYLVFARRFFGHGQPITVHGLTLDPAAATALIEPIAAFVLLIILAISWVVPSARASLIFTEAEAAFLFPAPITRRSLIHFKLIKSQLTVLLTSLVLSLVSNRWAFLGGSIITHALGWWLIFSFINLHLIGASFTSDRLATAGLTPPRRRLVILGLVLVLGAVTGIWIRDHLSSFSGEELKDMGSFLGYVGRLLEAPPLPWLLWPLRWVARPFLANEVSSFLRTLWPVLLLCAGQYLWIIRAEVAFEEASLAASQKRAERLAGRRPLLFARSASASARPAPFGLKPTGFPAVALLWSNLIAVGPRYYARSWALLALVLITLQQWLLSHPAHRAKAQLLGTMAGVLGAYALLLGPIFARRGAQRLIERLDAMKAYPLRGWEVILGELLSAIALLSAAEWIVIALLALIAGNGLITREFTPLLALTGGVGLALLVPPLVGLMFGLNYVGILYFPAWAVSTAPGPGIEKGGQRLIFFAAYLLVLLICLAPALGMGALVFFLAHLLSDSFVLGLGLTALGMAGVLAIEFAAMIWWLGARYESFDVSAELPR